MVKLHIQKRQIMKKFISLSTSSQNALKIAQISSTLPVNILVTGENGVGKKILIQEIFPNLQVFNGQKLEKMIFHKKINLDSFNTIVIYEIDALINKKDFFEKLRKIRVIATSRKELNEISTFFPVKITIEPLKNRKEDLDELINLYSNDAKKIYNCDIKIDDIKIDISQNGITLKQSIYKSILLKSLTKDELIDTMQDFFTREFENKQTTYKKLLEIFEIAILKSAKKIYKSQLQMALKLGINRITLRKKLEQYGE